MVEKEEKIKEKVNYSGVFNFSDFYSFAHRWLKNKNYGITEEKYSEKVSGNTRDMTIEWVATKQVSDYFKFEHKIKFEVGSLTDVEVEINGSKKKMNKGQVEVEIKGNLIKDPKSKWEGSPFTRFLRDVYNKYIVPQNIDTMEDIVMEDVRDFKDELKAFIDLTGKR